MGASAEPAPAAKPVEPEEIVPPPAPASTPVAEENVTDVKPVGDPATGTTDTEKAADEANGHKGP